MFDFSDRTLDNNNEEIEDFDELEEQTSELRIERRGKRKRTKSLNKSYDFRDYGVDQRRRGAKHQRRKENCELLIYDLSENFSSVKLNMSFCLNFIQNSLKLLHISNLCKIFQYLPLNTGQKLNIHKMFRRCPGCHVHSIYALHPGGLFSQKFSGE